MRWLDGITYSMDMKKESEVAQSCPTLCDHMDCSPPGSSVHGIFQARTLGGLLFPTPGDLSDSGIEPMSLAPLGMAGRFFITVPPGKSPQRVERKSRED